MREGRAPLRVVLLLFSMAAGALYGHELQIFAQWEGSRIAGRVRLSGIPVAGARIEVLDREGHRVQTSTSREDGSFELALPRPGTHRLVVETGDGHRATRSLSRPGDESAQEEAGRERLATPVSAGELERIVARQLRPLREELMAHEERLRVRDILGGIGYILGLSGLATLLLARQRRRS